MIAGLARIHAGDIDAAWNAVKDAERPRIHTFVSTSDIHIEHQMRTTREDVQGPRARRRRAREAVRRRRRVLADGRDARRRRLHRRGLQIAIDEGATTINIPDTVGYTMPHEYAAYLTRLYELRARAAATSCCRSTATTTSASPSRTRSPACWPARGRSSARSTASASAPATPSLEEIVMLLHTRAGRRRRCTPASSRPRSRARSRLVSRLTGYVVQPNKAIVGRNAFAHESGIHQDGVLKERTTFEIMDATTVGLDANSIVLGKHSGRHALRQALAELGIEVDGQALNTAFKRFKEIADKKKQVTAMDLEALVTDELREEIPAYALEWFDVEASSRRPPHATVGVTPAGRQRGDRLVHRRRPDRRGLPRDQRGDRAVDARLREFRVDAVTGGQDALGETSVVLELDGVTGAGQGVSTDIIEAAGRAYVRALSNAVRRRSVADQAADVTAEAASRIATP